MGETGKKDTMCWYKWKPEEWIIEAGKAQFVVSLDVTILIPLYRYNRQQLRSALIPQWAVPQGRRAAQHHFYSPREKYRMFSSGFPPCLTSLMTFNRCRRGGEGAGGEGAKEPGDLMAQGYERPLRLTDPFALRIGKISDQACTHCVDKSMWTLLYCLLTCVFILSSPGVCLS